MHIPICSLSGWRLLLLVLTLPYCCGCEKARQKHIGMDANPDASAVTKELITGYNDTTITEQIAGVPATFMFPETPRAALLLLPGWNFSRTDWCDSTDFCKQALSAGFVLITPEMRKSIYAREVYTETREDWREEITRQWFLKHLFPFARDSFGLLQEGENNFVAGISTGGRGAVILCQEAPEAFKACASLSGDFAPELMPDDNLLNGFLGPMQKFPERWAAESPVANADHLKAHVFLAHGEQDKIVPVEQSKALYDALMKSRKTGEIQLKTAPNGGHEYAFWGAQTEAVLAFFSRRITPGAPGS